MNLTTGIYSISEQDAANETRVARPTQRTFGEMVSDSGKNKLHLFFNVFKCSAIILEVRVKLKDNIQTQNIRKC